MNKRGFAVSIIIYSIVFLIIAILYMLLGIEKNRYTINSELRESIITNLNNNIDFPKNCEWISTIEDNLSTCSATSAYNRDNMINDPIEGDAYYECTQESELFYTQTTYTYTCT